MKIAIVADSTAFIPPALKTHPNLRLLDIPVMLAEKTFLEGVEESVAAFYQEMAVSSEFPKTSQPSVGEMITTFENLKKDGFQQVISIHLSSGISGTVSTVTSIKDEIPGLEIIPFDSLITSVPMGHMVRQALADVDAGKSVAEIIAHLEMIRQENHAFIVVDNLNQLVKGGRLTNGVALIGGLLKIKPVLTFTKEDGKIVVHEKIRTSKKALARVEDLLLAKAQADPDFTFFIIHANAKAEAEEEKARLLAENPAMNIEIAFFGPVIGAHLGEKALGFGWVKSK
ncbi:DegV family protein [Enterococcus nangangensis]|uniref:DegV family protein n=1 Tax=Enterococcus nangangensis TaxID=2559926 RepID=UPI0010F8D4CB|nr:DegV family protein [Enterococcus nangangensis]